MVHPWDAVEPSKPMNQNKHYTHNTSQKIFVTV